MLPSKTRAPLDAWLSDTAVSLFSAFAKGIAADRRAVEVAITEP